jgi:hypothetical protein
VSSVDCLYQLPDRPAPPRAEVDFRWFINHLLRDQTLAGRRRQVETRRGRGRERSLVRAVHHPLTYRYVTTDTLVMQKVAGSSPAAST